MIHTNNHLVIMAGGVGSRFWPMSTVDKPKQFIDVLGVGRSLMQLTYDRLKGITKPEKQMRDIANWFTNNYLKFQSATF